MKNRGVVVALALCASMAACGGSSPAPAQSSTACAQPERQPKGLDLAGSAAVTTFQRIAGACIMVDRKRLSNAVVAASIAADYSTETRTAAFSADAVPVVPLTSPAWLRWGAAHMVLADLVEQATTTDHVQVPDRQVQAAVANCRRAAQALHQSSPCTASIFRRDYAVMAEERRIKAGGQTMQQWFAAQLPKHSVYVSGYDVTLSELVAASGRPPGCNQSMGC